MQDCINDTAGRKNPAMKRPISMYLWMIAGICLLLLSWWGVSLVFDEIIIASPVKTISSLGAMMLTGPFWKSVGITFQRFALGLFFGSLTGFIFGLAAGLNEAVRWMLEPFRWILMTVPPAVLVVVSMIWFGMGSVQTIFVTGLLIMPIIYVNTVAGIDAVDQHLVEMAGIYRAPKAMQIRDLYMPGVGGHVLAGLSLSAGMGIRIVVLSELLGAYSGIGYEFALARTNLDTPVLFAWVLICLVLGGGLEVCVLIPMKNHIMKWQG
ncbi:MAG: ABC transporter permease [Deltaproteobacteria bacterium]|nr:MAG: ABC transporter permease [Deltaproteobacteria bacterium]